MGIQKKWCAVLLSGCLVSGLIACGGSGVNLSGSGANPVESLAGNMISALEADPADSNDLQTVGGETASGEGARDVNQVVPPENAMQIASAEDLLEFRDRVNAGETGLNAILMADIDLSGVCGEGTKDWVSIGAVDEASAGDTADENGVYEGIFEGGNHTISNLYGTDHGLFSSLADSGIIRNLVLTDVLFRAEQSGAPVADFMYGRVENCHVSGTVTGSTYAGGLVNTIYAPGVLSGCSFSGRMESCDGAGGLVCKNYGRIEQCRNVGNVLCMDSNYDERSAQAAGIACSSWGVVSGCTNAGNITAEVAGGIVGVVAGSENEALIEKCMNEGTVIGKEHAGGIACGCANDVVINRCGNTGAVSGGDAAGGIAHDGVSGSLTVMNCFQKGTICVGVYHINELFHAAGLDEYSFSDDILGSSNTWPSSAAGIVCRGEKAVNCYSQGSIRVESHGGSCTASGLVNFSYDRVGKNPVVAGCYTTAELSADEVMGIGYGNADEVESCYYSERTASSQYLAKYADAGLSPASAASFTDGTVVDALNQWVNNAGADYDSWKQGEDGPCFEWE